MYRTSETLQNLSKDFSGLLSALIGFVQTLPDEIINHQPGAGRRQTVTEDVVKSAAILEQAFGGLTTNLWDDPFEWTLPETLSSRELIIQYLGEVDASRERAFAFLADDSALSKVISVPSSGQVSVLEFLKQTLSRASTYHCRAAETLEKLSSV